MKILDGLILGLLQGLSEFLPISSSGHLFLANRLGIFSGEVTLLFAIMLHIGSLVAVVIVFWDKVKYVITHPLSDLTKNIILASIPTAILAGLARYFLPDAIEGALLPLGFFASTAFLFSTAFIKHGKRSVSAKSALVIGFVQGCAVLPGLSRSGATITAGQFCGVDRERAGEFSFLISIPIIIGSAFVEGLQLRHGGLDISVLPTIIGTLAAFVSGYVALIVLKNIIKKAKLHYFGIYTLALGLLALIM